MKFIAKGSSIRTSCGKDIIDGYNGKVYFVTHYDRRGKTKKGLGYYTPQEIAKIIGQPVHYKDDWREDAEDIIEAGLYDKAINKMNDEIKAAVKPGTKVAFLAQCLHLHFLKYGKVFGLQ